MVLLVVYDIMNSIVYIYLMNICIRINSPCSKINNDRSLLTEPVCSIPAANSLKPIRIPTEEIIISVDLSKTA